MAQTATRSVRATARALAVAIALSLALAAAACGDEQPASPSGDPHITGVVTSADPAAGSSTAAVFLVEQGTGDYDKASVTVSENTAWYRRAGGVPEATDPPAATDLAGKRVEVRFAGAVAESYPVQGTAAWVVVGE